MGSPLFYWIFIQVVDLSPLQAKRILIIGGNNAGLGAAGRAKRLRPDFQVLVLEKTPYTAYASCGLPYLISGKITSDRLSGQDPNTIARKHGIEVLVNRYVTQINLKRKVIFCHNQENEIAEEYRYDRLVLATGACPMIPAPLQGDMNNLFVLRNYSDALKLEAFIREKAPKTALVLGASYLGLEMAEALHFRGMIVHLVDKSPRLFPEFADRPSQGIFQAVEKSGVHLYLNSSPIRVEKVNNSIRCIHFSNHPVSLFVDFVVVTAGIRPQVTLAEESGIPLGETGAIAVDSFQQTRRSNVYAVGDCAESRHLITRRPVWKPLAGVASKQGRVVGSHIAGRFERFPGVLGTAVVKVFGLEIAHTGLSLLQAKAAHFDAIETVIEHDSLSNYLSENTPTLMALVFDRKTHRILGAQIVGANGAGLRINALVSAITGQLALDDLTYLDLGYTPPVSPLWDPIAIAGTVALKTIKEIR